MTVAGIQGADALPVWRTRRVCAAQCGEGLGGHRCAELECSRHPYPRRWAPPMVRRRLACPWRDRTLPGVVAHAQRAGCTRMLEALIVAHLGQPAGAARSARSRQTLWHDPLRFRRNHAPGLRTGDTHRGTPALSPGPARVGALANKERHAVIALPRPPGYRSPADASMSHILPAAVFPPVQRLAQTGP